MLVEVELADSNNPTLLRTYVYRKKCVENDHGKGNRSYKKATLFVLIISSSKANNVRANFLAVEGRRCFLVDSILIIGASSRRENLRYSELRKP